MKNKILSIFNLEKDKIFYFTILGFEKILILLFHFYFVNYLTSESYGIYSQTNFLSSVFQNILMFGSAIPFIISFTNSNISNKFFFNFFIPFSILSVLIVSTIIVIFGDFFSNFFYGNPIFFEYLLILIIVLTSDIISEYLIVFNRINNRLLNHSKFIFFRSMLKITSIITIYLFFEDFYLSFLISSILYLLYSSIFFSRTLRFRYKNLVSVYLKNKNKIDELLVDGLKFTFLYIIITSSSILINIMVVNQFDINTLAIYNFNFIIASAPLTLVGYVTFYSLPDFSQQYSQNSSIKKSNFFKDILFTSVVFALFFIIAFLLYDTIIYFAKDFYRNRFLFSIIFISNFIFMINNFLQFPLLSKKKYSQLIFITGVSLFLNILYIYFIAIDFSIITPVVGFFIANIFTLILLLISHIRFNK